MAKPVKVEYYETPTGPVKTLGEWKRAAIKAIIDSIENGNCTRDNVITAVLENAASMVEILSVKETGRPIEKRDGKPRAVRSVMKNPTPLEAA